MAVYTNVQISSSRSFLLVMFEYLWVPEASCPAPSGHTEGLLHDQAPGSAASAGPAGPAGPPANLQSRPRLNSSLRWKSSMPATMWGPQDS